MMAQTTSHLRWHRLQVTYDGTDFEHSGHHADPLALRILLYTTEKTHTQLYYSGGGERGLNVVSFILKDELQW